MGSQQLLLILLGVIIVCVAIFIGQSMFGSKSVALTKNAMVNDMSLIAAQAYQYKMRPSYLGGGGGSFVNFVVPDKFKATANGTYEIETVNHQDFRLIGTSKDSYGTVICSFNQKGKMSGAPILSGKFAESE